MFIHKTFKNGLQAHYTQVRDFSEFVSGALVELVKFGEA